MNVNRILVATDFGGHSEVAVARACELAKKFDAALHLIHVATSKVDVDTIRLLSEKLNSLLDPHYQLDLSVERQVLVGTACGEIVDYARRHRIDLIVMGTHGRSGLAHLTLGSVAERVLRGAPCPVLVVKPGGSSQEAELWNAAQVLSADFGRTLLGKRQEGHARLTGRLARELNTSDAQTQYLIQQLEATGVLKWAEAGATAGEPEHWEINLEPLEPATESRREAPDATPQAPPLEVEASPALDLVQRALTLRATDIHIDPAAEGSAVVRFRIDGRLEQYCLLDQDVAEHLNHQFKMLASLDIADPFTPKEGRLRLPSSMPNLEVRITSSPVAGGEATALRLFSKDNVFYPLSELGFSDQAQADVESMLQLSEGLVLVTGPTGTGKTTTVYSMLEVLGTGPRNIVSIEDPVEFAASFVRQMTVDERHGITMTTGLRTLLRMDPDIIFVGEIRDAETADIAMRAASSGRHVFSTLHTRDVAATVTALRDLRIDNRSIAGNLTGVINQRLLRRLCTKCLQRPPTTDEQAKVFADNGLEAPAELCRAEGCDACRGTGFHGRVGAFEAIVIDETISRAISDGKSEEELRSLIRSGGTLGVTANALAKAAVGVTSYEEALAARWL